MDVNTVMETPPVTQAEFQDEIADVAAAAM